MESEENFKHNLYKRENFKKSFFVIITEEKTVIFLYKND